MKKIREIFSFNVLEEIKEGNTVYAVDKAKPYGSVLNVNQTKAENAVSLINSNTAIFWTIIEESEETDNG